MTTNLNERLAITAVGTCTCVGQNTQQTSASIRAGLNRFVEHPAYLSVARAGADPEDPVPPAVAMVPTLDPELNSQDRLMQLLITAFRDLVHNRQFNRSMMARAGFFLALPSDDPDMMPFGIGTDFVKDFRRANSHEPVSGDESGSIRQHRHGGIDPRGCPLPGRRPTASVHCCRCGFLLHWQPAGDAGQGPTTEKFQKHGWFYPR
jgi:hypothetical protein